MPKFIFAAAVWLFKPAPPRAEVRSVRNAGWLGRHSSRSSGRASAPHEPYVDLGPLDLTRRH
jgi:hypothetical protein